MIKSDGIFHFKTKAAANLYDVEIQGQISDGAWENARPQAHWEYWCGGKIIVDGKVGREGTALRTNYNLKQLKKYIKEEMKNCIRITKMPWFTQDYAALTRDLTSEFAEDQLKKEGTTWYASKYFKPAVRHTAAYFENDENGKWRVDDMMKNVRREMREDFSDEFAEALCKEAVRQLVNEYAEFDSKTQALQDKNLALLNEIGIKDEASFVEMVKTIRAVEVTDAELDAALNEISQMMTTYIS